MVTKNNEVKEKSKLKSKARVYEADRFKIFDREIGKEVPSDAVEKVIVDKLELDNGTSFFTVAVVDRAGVWHKANLNKSMTAEQREALSQAKKKIMGKD